MRSNRSPSGLFGRSCLIVACGALAGASLGVGPAAGAGEVDDLLVEATTRLEAAEGAAPGAERDAALDEAISLLEKASSLNPENAPAHFHLGRAQALSGAPARAYGSFEQAEQLGDKELAAAARSAREAVARPLVEEQLERAKKRLATRRHRLARKAFERAFDLAEFPSLLAERAAARAGYAEAAVLETIGRLEKAGGHARLRPTIDVEGSGAAAFAALLTEGLERGIAASDKLERSASGGDADVEITCGQRLVLRVTDAKKEGAVLAEISLRALPEKIPETVVAPDPVELVAAVETPDPEKGFRTLFEGDRLASGTQFRIRAKASRDVYLYVIMVDAQGATYTLYPGTERIFPELAQQGVKTPHQVPALRPTLVPPAPPRGEYLWFFLDQNTGVERFYVVAAVQPIGRVDALLAAPPSPEQSRKLRAALVELAGPTVFEEDSAFAGLSHEKVKGKGVVVRHLWIEHTADAKD